MTGNLFNFTNLVSADLTLGNVILNMLISVCLGLLIFHAYKRSYDGVVYSKSFNITLVMVTVVTSMIMMIIGSNLALSLGMVGALSIIRFRSAIKEPRDLGFLFWSIAAGLASGTGSYGIAIVGSLSVTAVIVIFYNIKDTMDSFLLIARGQKVDEKKLMKILDETGIKYRLKMKSMELNSAEIIMEVSLDNAAAEKLLNDLKNGSISDSINLVAYNGEISG